jgi:protein TonB
MDVAAVEDASHNLPQPAPTPQPKAVEAPQPSPEMKAAPDDSNTKGANEYVPLSRKVAQVEMTDEQYGALVVKRAREHQVISNDVKRRGLQGVPLVSFVILTDGSIRPESLKIAKSSGQPLIDAGALETIRASVPFPPPPKETAITIGLAYGPTR